MVERNGWTLSELLEKTEGNHTLFARASARENLADLSEVLHQVNQKLRDKAGTILEWVDQAVGFQQYYEDFYGSGEISLTRMAT